MGIHGFSGVQSILYHLHPPTAIERIEERVGNGLKLEYAGPLRHRLIRAAKAPEQGDAVSGRVPLLTNRDLVLSVVRFREPMAYWYRYAHGDELLFVHEGHGVLETQYGRIGYRPGDYLVLPTGVIWRLLPRADEPQRMLCVEAAGHIEPPRRYVNRYGQFLENSPYCERDIRAPQWVEPRDEEGEFEVRVKARGGTTRYLYRRHPMDVAGWDGHLWPYAFNIEDFEPITGRVHQPPPVHQTFDGPGLRRLLLRAAAVRLPPAGDSGPLQPLERRFGRGHLLRRGRLHVAPREWSAGSLTVHPNGIPHGPHPGAYEGSIGKERTDELAVMVDTFRPLQMTAAAADLEDESYAYSWRG